MNKIYKVVWNKARNCYVVASEFAKGQTKSAGGHSKCTEMKTMAAVAAIVMGVFVMPLGGTTVFADKVGDPKVVPDEGYSDKVELNNLKGLSSADNNILFSQNGSMGLQLKLAENIAVKTITAETIKTSTGATVDLSKTIQGVRFDEKGNLYYTNSSGETNYGTVHDYTITDGSYDADTKKLTLTKKDAYGNQQDSTVDIDLSGIAAGSDGWTAQANGTDVKAKDGKVNFKEGDNIKVTTNGDGEMTISASGLAKTEDVAVVYGNKGGNDDPSSKSLHSTNAALVHTDNAVALGDNTKAWGKNAIALGKDSQAFGENTFAAAGGIVGSMDSHVMLPGGEVIDAYTDIKNGIAIGKGSVAGVDDGIALGSDSQSLTGAGQAGYDLVLNDSTKNTTDSTWTSTKGALSIGGVQGATRQITNVAAGTQDTDAVNVAQLKQVRDLGLTFQGDELDHYNSEPITKKLTETLHIKGNADKDAYFSDGNIGVLNDGNGGFTVKLNRYLSDLQSVTTNNAYVTKVDENNDNSVTNVTYVKDQIAGVKLKAGNGISITDKKINVKLKNGEQNLAVDADGLSLNKELKGITSISGAGDGNISFADGNITVNKNTFNKDGKIQNVAEGKEDTDAVNVAQLNRVSENAAKHTTLVDGENTTVEKVNTTDGHLEYKVNVDLSGYAKSDDMAVVYKDNNKENSLHSTNSGDVGTGSIVLGKQANAVNDSIALGNGASVVWGSHGQGGVAIGNNSRAGYKGISLGNNAGQNNTKESDLSSREGAIIIGDSANSQGLYTTVIGTNSRLAIDGTPYTILGKSALVQGALSTSYGAMNTMTSNNKKVYSGIANSVVGSVNTVTNSNGITIQGTGNTVTGAYKNMNINFSDLLNINKGDYSFLAKKDSGAIAVIGGANTISDQTSSTVIGFGNTLTGNNSKGTAGVFTAGSHNTLKNVSNSLIMGDNNTLQDRTNVISLGNKNKVEADNAVAIGNGSTVTVKGGVAIGTNSVADRVVKEGSAGAFAPDTIPDAEKSIWTATAGAVSVGDANQNITRQITNVAAGSEDTDAVNVAQLKKVQETITGDVRNKTFGLADDKGSTITKNLDNTVQVKGANGITSTVKDGALEISLGKDITVGNVGKDGKDGEAGSIGLVGPAGKDGKDGLTTTIIKTEYGPAGVDGKDGITRIVYETKDGVKHEVATLDDGLKFHGDIGSVADVKLNKQVNITGGITDKTKLSDNNIGVVTETDNAGNATLKVKLNKDLTGLNSVTTNNAYVTNVDASNNASVTNVQYVKDQIANSGWNLTAGTGASTAIKSNNTVTFDTANGVTIAKEEIQDKTGNVTGAKVTVGLGDTVHVGAIAIGKQAGGGANITDGKYITGLDNKAWDKENIASGRAATEDQLKEVQNSITTDIGGKTFGLTDDNGTAITKNLDSTVQVKGANGITSTVKDGALEIGLGNNITVGKDGKDGAAGSIGLVGPAGKDGKDGLTTTIIKTEYGPAGVDGKDGITRIVYETKDGVKHEVATLDDGLKFHGDIGSVADVKLNKQVNITGGITDKTKLSDNNIGVVTETDNAGNATLKVKLNKDLTGLNSAKFGDTMTINADGLTVGNGTTGLEFSTKRVSVGGQQIHDVADGKDDMDAVNVSQLKGVESVANKGWNLSTNGKEATPVKPGETVDFSGDDNISVSKDGRKVTTKLNSDLKNIETISNGQSKVVLNKGYAGMAYGDTSIALMQDNVVLNSKVTVGKDGKISGIAEGRIAADSTDAVNGSQLHAVQQEAGKHTKVVNGSNITVEETDQDGQKTYKVGLNKDILLGDITGKYVSISGSNGTIDTTGYIATKDRVYADKGAKLADVDVSGDTISNGKSSVKLDKEGTVTINDNVTVDSTGKISGVAKGDISDTSTDAVNGSQLKETNDRVSKVEGDITNIKGDITNIKGDITSIKQDVTNLGDRVTQVEQTAGKHSSVSAGDSNIKIDDSKTNAAGGTDYKVSLNKDLTLDSMTTGDTKMDTNGVKIGENVSLTKDGLTAGDTKVTNSGLSIGDKTYVSKDGLNANNQTITNVADGKVEKGSTDAVNGGQLYETNQAIANNATNISSLSHSISNLDNRVNKVGAGAAALAALHPLDFDPDAKWDFAAGYGNYRGAGAAAIGAYYRPNEDTMFSVGGTFGNGENMVNAGVSFKLGSGSSHVSTSRVAMAKEIKELRSELEAMKSAILDANAGKKVDTSKLQLFPDVPQNHWAYEYVTQLAERGMIEGYPDGNFAGDRPMTRYEFAAILYRAMTKGAVLSDKILNEFSHELEYFTVDTIAKDKAGNPTIQRVRTVKANTNK